MYFFSSTYQRQMIKLNQLLGLVILFFQVRVVVFGIVVVGEEVSEDEVDDGENHRQPDADQSPVLRTGKINLKAINVTFVLNNKSTTYI